MLGQECTISCYQHISIGRECIIADRVMMIDFDHGMVEVERPIREQGIYKRDVDVGHNVWIGYGACVLRGVTVGDNSVVGTSAVVTARRAGERGRRRRAGAADPDARGAADVRLGRLAPRRLTRPASTGSQPSAPAHRLAQRRPASSPTAPRSRSAAACAAARSRG